ncbi:MAG: hypothetical protein EXR27_13615 [Betaproteobacteria bacterium]|nr:hypothetical protein [Betaproteobacteria bacterium]
MRDTLTPSLSLAATLFAASAAVFAPATAHSQEAVVRAGHFIPPVNSLFRTTFDTWMARVNAEGKGLISIPRVVSVESIPGEQMATAVRNGVLDMAALPSSYYYNVVPEAEATLLSDFPPPEQRQRGAIAFLQPLLAQKMNAMLLGQYGYNVRLYLFLTKEVTTLADFKPLRLRTNPSYRPFFNRLVNSQIQMSRGEVYTGLERGVIDGYANPMSEVKPAGWDKVTKFRVDPGFYNSIVHIIVGKKWWDSLRPDQRAFLDRMSQEVLERELDPKIAELDTASGVELEKNGIKTIRLAPTIGQQFVKTANDAHWDELTRVSPDNVPKLRPMLSK